MFARGHEHAAMRRFAHGVGIAARVLIPEPQTMQLRARPVIALT